MDQSASASAGQQTTESTMAMDERILEALQQLKDEEFESFKWFLTRHNVEGLDPLKKSAGEHAKRTHVVDQILQAYPGRETEIMQAILSRMNRNDLANTFGNTPTVIQRDIFRACAVRLSLRHGHAGPPKGVRHVIQRANFRACAVCLLLLFLVAAAITVHLTIYHSATCQPKTDSNQTENYSQLENSYRDLTLEKNQLQREVNQLKCQMGEVKSYSCPSGWKKFRCSCYYLITGYKTWQDGRRECQNQGADLVVINSGEEQVFLRGLKPGSYSSWIGLQRTGGTWAWLDGTPLTTQYWHAGFPDNDGDCGRYAHVPDPGTWVNWGCSDTTPAICEK